MIGVGRHPSQAPDSVVTINLVRPNGKPHTVTYRLESAAEVAWFIDELLPMYERHLSMSAHLRLRNLAGARYYAWRQHEIARIRGSWTGTPIPNWQSGRIT